MSVQSSMRTLRLSEAVNEAIREEMAQDERVLLYGVSVGAGLMNEAKGLSEEFGSERCFTTPISENSNAGMAIGLALAGYRPIVAHLSGGFVFAGFEETVPSAAEWRATHGGVLSLPLVWLVRAGGGFQTGASHSHFLSGTLLQFPGIKIAVPSTPYDAKGLMKSAIREDNPVVFLTPLRMGALIGEVPEGDYTVPFGQAQVLREGAHVTVVSFSAGTSMALQVADQLSPDVDVEVVDLRTLEPLDLDTILASVEKTGRLVVVDEDVARGGVSAEIAALVMENAFGSLHAPVQRVGRLNVSLPAGPLEAAVLPDAAAIRKAVLAATEF